MKKSIKPILLAISILIITASAVGCEDNEKTTDTSVADTEGTSSSGSSSSAEESVISSTTTTTNPYDTSKPIDTTTPPASSSTESSTTSEPEEKPENSSTNSEPTNSSSNSEPTNSSSNSKPAQSSSRTSTPNPLDPSNSSSSSSKPSTPSSSSGSSSSSGTSSGSKPSLIKIPDGSTGEYFDVNGNPMPSGFDPSNGGYYNKNGCYVMTPTEFAEYNRQAQEAGNTIGKGGTSGMTQADRDYLDSLLGI